MLLDIRSLLPEPLEIVSGLYRKLKTPDFTPTSLRNRVRFVVRGRRFETTVATLCNIPNTLLNDLIDITPSINAVFDEISIDRNPRLFRLIINFIRDGRVAVNERDEELLRKEAEFYRIPSLIQWLDEMNFTGLPFERGDKVLTKDENMRRLFRDNDVTMKGWADLGQRYACSNRKIVICPQCHTDLSEIGANYRTLLDVPRSQLTDVGTVRKVYPHSKCVDVRFGVFKNIFHLPADWLILNEIL